MGEGHCLGVVGQGQETGILGHETEVLGLETEVLGLETTGTGIDLIQTDVLEIGVGCQGKEGQWKGHEIEGLEAEGHNLEAEGQDLEANVQDLEVEDQDQGVEIQDHAVEDLGHNKDIIDQLVEEDRGQGIHAPADTGLHQDQGQDILPRLLLDQGPNQNLHQGHQKKLVPSQNLNHLLNR